MHSKTRIIILRMKSIIYTLLLFFFVVILLVMFAYMFFLKPNMPSEDSQSTPTYNLMQSI